MSYISDKISLLSKTKLEKFDEDATEWLAALERNYETLEEFAEGFYDNYKNSDKGEKYIGEACGEWSLFFEYLTGEVADGNEDPREILNVAFSRGISPSESSIKFINSIFENGY